MPELIAAATILFFASFLQSTVGFGFGMLSIPLLLRTGMPLASAVTLALSAVMIQGLTVLGKMHRDIPWKPTLTATSLRILGIPLGIVCLKAIDAAARSQVKMLVGVVILGMVAVRLFWRVPEHVPNRWWQVPSFLTSGFLVGLIGMGGPPMVLWVTAQHWKPRSTRGFLMAVFLLSLPANLFLLYQMVGPEMGPAILKGILFGPVVVAGSLVGVRMGDKLDKAQLSVAVYTILTLLGLGSLFG